MRFKAAILLLTFIFVTLFSVGGCAKPGDEQNAPAPSEIRANPETQENSFVGEISQDGIEAKEAGNAKDELDDRVDEKPMTNLGGGNAAAPPTTESLATGPVNQPKISLTGPGVGASQEFTLKELKQMNDILVSANYFSRGAEKPGWAKTAHTVFSGVLLYELLADYGGLNAAGRQVKIIAEDNYTQVFSIEEIKANYIDETDDRKKLRVIIAWSQDGQEYDASQGAPFRLVMGQQFAGDYNRQKWVSQIARIVVE